MKQPPVQLVFGALLLCAGVLLVVDTIGVITSPIPWAIVLAGAAATFGYVFVSDRASWWAAIPAGALFGAALTTLMELDSVGLSRWTAVPVLGGISLAFWVVYLRDRRRWWSLIPAGILLTLAVVTVVDTAAGPNGSGAVFLIGAAITFILVAALPGGESRRWWAWIPAGALAIAAIVVLINVPEWLILLNILWPLLVIGSGALVISSAVIRRRAADRAKAPDVPSTGRNDR